jgi:hypothetical protein
MFAIRHALCEAHHVDLDPEVPALCPKCRTWLPWVTFEAVPSYWPEEIVCGLCHDMWRDEMLRETAFDSVHGGACGCPQCA